MPLSGLELNSAYAKPEEIPKSTHGFQTHNLYKDFPPFMKDGRVIKSNYDNYTITIKPNN